MYQCNKHFIQLALSSTLMYEIGIVQFMGSAMIYFATPSLIVFYNMRLKCFVLVTIE